MHEASTSAPVASRRAACPRCGYDLQGVATTWRDVCPLRQTCAECGLDIDLVALLGRDQIPDWFVGAPGGPVGRLLRVPGTMLRFLLPGFPWRTLTVERLARVPVARLLGLWASGLLLVLLLAILVPTTIVEVQQFRRDVTALQRFQESSRTSIARAEAEGWTPDDGLRNPGILRSREEVLELVRACEDEGRPYRLAAGYLLDRLVSGEDRRLRGGAILKGRLKYYGAGLGLRSVVTPARDLFGGRFWSARDPFPRNWRMLPGLALESFRPFLPPLLATFATPLAFVLIPVTRRRARVEPGMLVRVGSLALAGPVLLLVVACFGHIPGLEWISEGLAGEPRSWWRPSGRAWLVRSLAFAVGTAFWGWLWWWGACRMLRLPRAGLVAGGLFSICLLIMLVLLPSDLLRWTILF